MKLEKIMIKIPTQLQNENYRFLLLQNKSKNPIENVKWGTINFDYKNKELLNHLENNNNYGVIGGYGNLRIIDVDNQKIGRMLLDKLDTFTVKTQSGNYHFYIISEYNKNHVFKKSSMEANIGEFRADNYYVVGPNCYVEDNKKETKGNYEIIKDIDIKKVNTEELFNLIGALIKKENINNVNLIKIIDKEILLKDIVPKMELYIQDLILNKKTKEELQKIGYTSRSERDMKVVTYLLLNGFGSYIESIFKFLEVGDKYREHTSPKSYLEKTILKARDYTGVRDDLVISVEKEINFMQERILKNKLDIILTKIINVTDWVQQKYLLSLIAFKIKINKNVLDKRLEELKIINIPKHSPLSLNELIKKPLPELEYYLYPIIPKNCLIIVGGKPESFKSMFLLSSILFMKTNKIFLDNFETKTIPKVLYYDLENGEKIQHRRLLYLSKGNNIDLSTIDEYFHFQFSFNPLNLNNELELCKNYDIIILDSYRRFLEGTEDDSGITNKFFNDFLFKLRSMNKTVIIIHHFRKQKIEDINSSDVLDAFRGSGDITAQLDLVYALFKTNEIVASDRKISQFDISVIKAKCRDTYPIHDFNFTVIRDDDNKNTTFRFGSFKKITTPKERREELIIKFIQEKNEVNIREIISHIMSETECSEITVKKDLNRLVKDGIIINNKYGIYNINNSLNL